MTYKARVYYTGAGSTFSVPFPYLSKADVKLYLAGAEVDEADFSWPNDSQVTLDTAKANGSTLMIRRETPGEEMLHTIQVGTINPPDINVNDLQLLYLIQEREDEAARAIRLNDADPYSGTNLVPITRAGRLLGFDATTKDPVATNFSFEELEEVIDNAAAIAVLVAQAEAAAAAATRATLQPRILWTDFSLSPAAAATNTVKWNTLQAAMAALGVLVCLPPYVGLIPMNAEALLLNGGGVDCEVPGSAGFTFANANGSFPHGSYLYAGGSFTAMPDLDADITHNGALSTTLASAPATPLVEGDVLFIVDKAVLWNTSRAYYYEGEATHLHSADGADVYFQSPLISSYTAAGSVVSKLNPVHVVIRNIVIVGGGLNQADGSMFGWQIFAGQDCYVENVKVTNCNLLGGCFNQSVDCYLDKGVYNKLLPAAASDSYGCAVANSQNIRISNIRGASSRHVVTMGGSDTDQSILTRYVIVSDSLLQHNAQSDSVIHAADMHGMTQYCGYVNCIVDALVLGGSDNFFLGGTLRCGDYLGLPLTAVELSEFRGGSLVIKPNILEIRGVNPFNMDYGTALNAGWSGGGINTHTTVNATIIFEPGVVTYRADGLGSGEAQALISIQNNGSTANIRIFIGGDWRFEDLDAGNYISCSIRSQSGADFDLLDLSKCRGFMAWNISGTTNITLDGADLDQTGLNKTAYTPAFNTGFGVYIADATHVSARGTKLRGGKGGPLKIDNAVSVDLDGLYAIGYDSGIVLAEVSYCTLRPGDLHGLGITASGNSTKHIRYIPGVNDGTITKGSTDWREILFSPPRCSVYLHADQGSLSTAAFNKVLFDTVALDTDAWWDATNKRYTPLVAGRYRVSFGVSITGSSMTENTVAGIYKNGAKVAAPFIQNGLTAATQGSNYNAFEVEMNGSTDYIEGWAYIPANGTAIKTGTDFSTYMQIDRVK